MSSTRTAQPGSPFKQNRFASSPAFNRALKANLVAARASVLENVKEREAVYFIQHLSMFAGGLRWAASEVAPAWLHGEDRERWLATLCLDPASNQDLQEAAPNLRKLMAGYVRQKSEGTITTNVGSMVNEALDYCSQSKCLVMISGRPRLGKTVAAQNWVAQHPGQARYCEIPPTPDDLSFFTALADALGVSGVSSAKRKNLQPRIESVLEGGDLVLVADETMNLWPSHNYRKHSRPPRISWLMSMVNRGASITLLVTPNFFSNQQDYLDKSRWQDAQFYGRVERYVALPDNLSIADLEKVARAWLPHGDKRSIEALADYANLSQKYLAAIEHTVKHACFLAKQDGRDRPELRDIHQAMQSNILPSDTDLAATIDRAAARRMAPANGSRR